MLTKFLRISRNEPWQGKVLGKFALTSKKQTIAGVNACGICANPHKTNQSRGVAREICKDFKK